MSPFRPDRRRRGVDHLLPHKMMLFVAGAVLGMIGMAMDRNWIVYLAVGVLAVGLLLRFVDRGAEPPED